MNNFMPRPGEAFTLSYRDQPDRTVRAVFTEGIPWFDAADICDLLKLPIEAIGRFDESALDTDLATFAFDDRPTAVLSPIGVYKLSMDAPLPQGPQVSAWAKRVSCEIVLDPAQDDARMHLTLNPDGTLPRFPHKFSGRRSDFYALRYSPVGVAAAEAAARRFHPAALMKEKRTVNVVEHLPCI
jgi:hypothetical protein